MSGGLLFGRLCHILIGYLVAVVVAVLVTVGAVFAPSVLPDDGAWGSIYANLRQGQSVLFGGLMITVPTALPGFLIAVVFSILGRWRSWIPFTLAGGANGLFSWLVLGSYLGQLFWPVEHGILAASGIGGLGPRQAR